MIFITTNKPKLTDKNEYKQWENKFKFVLMNIKLFEALLSIRRTVCNIICYVTFHEMNVSTLIVL